MEILGLGRPPDNRPIEGSEYIRKLHKYLTANISRLAPAPQRSKEPTFFQQSYTLLTLGLDPNSKPLSRNVKVPLTLGFGGASETKVPPVKPILLRLPPDRLLYLLLRWQSLPQALPHVGRTDVPISPGVPVAARGARVDERERKSQGDVDSVKSWVGSMRSVSLGTVGSQATTIPGFGWMSKKEEVTEDQLLLALYSAFSVLPALLIHPPFLSDKPISELVEAGGYTQLGGIDVRIPLDVLRNLQTLELEAYDPRGLLIPTNPGLRSLTVRDVQDADDWLEELLAVETDGSALPTARFPNLRHLSLHSTTMISFPSLPLHRLTHLDLSHNLLNSIPTSLSSLHSLQSLNLSHNMIVSVRNAPQVLGNITTLNLSKNRIDCLVGLERLLGLERVDVRSNELYEVGEVGRLSVLPHIKEVWCVNNNFDQAAGGDWRTDLGIAFASEGRSVTVDDRPWTWQETRNIDAALATKGRQSHSRQPSATTAARVAAPPPPRNGQRRTEARPGLDKPEPKDKNADAGPSKTPRTHMSPTTATATTSPGSTSSNANANAVHKKRRPRRVITLDDDVAEEPTNTQEDRIGGSLRLPKTERTKGDGDRKVGTTTASVTVPKKTQTRSGIGAHTFQPPDASGK